MTIAVVGSGLVGCGWAVIFARAEHDVRLYDTDAAVAARALVTVRSTIDELAANDLLGGQSSADVASRVTIFEDLADAVRDAEHVQECVPEDAAVKAAALAAIAAVAPPDAVLASSTSSIVPSAFTAEVAGRERCLVAHPINPPHLHPTVELVPAPWTDPRAMARTRALLEAAGMEPVELAVELDGFVVNRIQSAVLHEAFRLVASGAVSADDVDRAVRGALAPRWSFMGPFETIDLNAPDGIRQYVERYGPLYERLAASQNSPVNWAATVDGGLEAQRIAALPREHLGERRAWRDRQLMAFAKHRARASL